MFGFATTRSHRLALNTFLIVLACHLALAMPNARANTTNLLSNAGFENQLTTNFLNVAGSPYVLDEWGGEDSLVVSSENGVTPNTGNSMLRVNPTSGVSSQTVQLLNLNNMATQIDAGNLCVNFSALVNAHQNFATGPNGSLVVVFINSNLSGNLILNTSNHTGPIVGQPLTTDIDPATWQSVAIQNATIPIGTRHILIQISFGNSSLGTLPAYVDSSSLCISPKGPPNVFFSYSGLNQGCARINRNLKNPNVGTAHTVYVWVCDDYEIDMGLCLDVFTSNPNVIQFTAAETLDANISVAGTPIGVRWGDFFGPALALNTDFIDELCAFTVTQGTGILASQTTGNLFEDQLHDDSPGTDAFLFAVIDFEVVGQGFTEICAQVGNGGAAHNGNAINPLICKATVNGVVPGDVNGDCVFNLLDVGPFINLLSNGGFSSAADMNCDGTVNLLDVELFVLALSGICP